MNEKPADRASSPFGAQGHRRTLRRVALASVVCLFGLTACAHRLDIDSATGAQRADGAPAGALHHEADPVVFRFATVGDSRQDPTYPDPSTLVPPITGQLLAQDAFWLQNSRAWSRIVQTISTQRAQMLIVNGDMVMGGGLTRVPAAWSTKPPSVSEVADSDIARLYRQYAYWRGMVAGLFESGTYVLPLPGNHEVQCDPAVTRIADGCAKGKRTYQENEQAWRDNMGDLILDRRRFKDVVGMESTDVIGDTTPSAPGAEDGVTTDQSKLTYSFDVNTPGGRLHFALLNTYAVGVDGAAPIRWLENDLQAARARGARGVFVFGHKPAFRYDYMAARGKPMRPDGLDPREPGKTAGSERFWQVIAQNGATYFAGHEHIFHIQKYPAVNSQRGAWQVLVGSGGSPFEFRMEGKCPQCRVPALNEPTDRHYAWATVSVHQSGRVSLEAWGFDEHYGPTTRLLAIDSLQ